MNKNLQYLRDSFAYRISPPNRKATVNAIRAYKSQRFQSQLNCLVHKSTCVEWLGIGYIGGTQ